MTTTVIRLSVEYDEYKLRDIYQGDSRKLNQIILDEVITNIEDVFDGVVAVKSTAMYNYEGEENG